MKKKLIILIVIGMFIIAGGIATVIINTTSSNKVVKGEVVKANEDIEENEPKENVINKDIENTEDSISKDDDNQKDEKDVDVKESNQKEVDKEISKQTNTSINKAKNEVGQSIDEGYELSYKAREAYENGDIDKAIELYEKITNKDALAKTVDEKNKYYFARHIDNEIIKCENLYNSGDYMNARINIKELLGGNRMTEGQMERCRALIKKTDSKVGQSGESELNKNFTYEKALDMIKKQFDRPNQEYKCLNQVIDSDGLKTFYIFQKDKGKDIGTLYMVNSKGKVQETS